MAKSKTTAKSKSGKKMKAAKQSGSDKAGILFPVGRVNRLLKEGRHAERISNTAGAFMAGSLQYIANEMFEVSSVLCKEQKMKIIQPRHLNMALKSDDEFAKLLKCVQISNGGQRVFIHDALKKRGKGMKFPGAIGDDAKLAMTQISEAADE